MKLKERMNIFGIVLGVVVLLGTSVRAQEADLSLRVEMNENLVQAQSINVQSLMANKGQGPNLFRMFLRNNSSEPAENLYLEIIVSSDKIGRILSLRQVRNMPFSLDPGQQVYATNNNMRNGLPGVEEPVPLEGDLTPEGRTFVNSMQGNTTLPAARYSIEINIYQGSGFEFRVASDMAEAGANIIESAGDFYLFSPGDEVESEAVIFNPYPNFQWQGMSGSTYRLIVVEADGSQTPQSLIGSAASTDPISRNGSSAGGSLLDFEMLDIVMNQSTFQYPNSGVQDLEPGKTYYWRVIGQLETASGQETRDSEIWSFTLSDRQDRRGGITLQNQELNRSLQILLGNQYEELRQNEYLFQSLRVEGQILQGVQAIKKLRELSRRAEEGEVSIIIENQ